MACKSKDPGKLEGATALRGILRVPPWLKCLLRPVVVQACEGSFDSTERFASESFGVAQDDRGVVSSEIVTFNAFRPSRIGRVAGKLSTKISGPSTTLLVSSLGPILTA